jgi:lipooligosaccharide transport system permease protein
MKRLSVNPWGVYSVWHRHAKVYQRTWLVNCLPPISEPIMYLIAFGLEKSPMRVNR